MHDVVTAIIIDGGFYRKRSRLIFGEKTPIQRAEELTSYCNRHIKKSESSLYRIYYYDCPPSEKVVYHPLTQSTLNLAKTPEYAWMKEFLSALTKRRKLALCRGEELATQGSYNLKSLPLKQICNGELSLDELEEDDFYLSISQKGIDMRMGLDIASLAYSGHVNQIVMISGDSSVIPAADLARRQGIDFILDPLWIRIPDVFNEHVDGVRQCVNREPRNLDDPLHADNLARSGDFNDED
ncbi:NYN domain-containing protein [Arcanobacterium haemolyticum]|nr:NYN domain-containing protein [Arcanobacterium haemolyticum]